MQRRAHDSVPLPSARGQEQVVVHAEAGWVIIEFLLDGQPVALRRLTPENARRCGADSYDLAGEADMQRRRQSPERRG